MLVRLSSLLVWALVGAGAVYWGLKLWAPEPSIPQSVAVTAAATPPTDLSRLAGTTPSPAAAAPQPAAAPGLALLEGRLRLVGVINGAGPAGGAPGIALIAVDGAAPKAFTLNQAVTGEWVLLSLSQRAAHLGLPGQSPQLQLKIEPPAAPASRAGG